MCITNHYFCSDHEQELTKKILSCLKPIRLLNEKYYNPSSCYDLVIPVGRIVEKMWKPPLDCENLFRKNFFERLVSRARSFDKCMKRFFIDGRTTENVLFLIRKNLFF